MKSLNQNRIQRLRFRFVVAVALILSVWLVDSITFQMRCRAQFQHLCQDETAELSLFICRHDYHLFLTDHQRSLVAFQGDEWLDSVELYADAGTGGKLHYVKSKNEIRAIDMNGAHFRITERGIEALGWRWMSPLPQGELRRISSYGSSHYSDEELFSPPRLEEVYIYKDSSP
ncbi:MAG: hypothetical protein VYC39_12905 [Myxococcota bacterium]|nr:hypothetical protein [Myxococcota bacterium]